MAAGNRAFKKQKKFVIAGVLKKLCILVLKNQE